MFIDSVKANFDYCNVSLSEIVCRVTLKDTLFDLIKQSDDNNVILIHLPKLVSITLYHNFSDNVIEITPGGNCKNIKSEYFEDCAEIIIENKNSNNYKIVSCYGDNLNEFKFFMMKDGVWIWLASAIVKINKSNINGGVG